MRSRLLAVLLLAAPITLAAQVAPAARVCIDHGFLDEVERYYRRGTELGNMEPRPSGMWPRRASPRPRSRCATIRSS